MELIEVNFSLVARNTFEKAKIYSFDPLQTSGEVFKKVFLNDKNTFFYNFAIGPSQEERIIYISKKEDSSSLLPIEMLQSNLFHWYRRVTSNQNKS